MNERDMLLKRISVIGFSMFDLHLFLDSHPGNQDALRLYNSMMPTYEALVREFESKYGPLNTGSVQKDNMWDWIKDPWPWDYTEEE